MEKSKSFSRCNDWLTMRYVIMGGTKADRRKFSGIYCEPCAKAIASKLGPRSLGQEPPGGRAEVAKGYMFIVPEKGKRRQVA